MSLSPLLLRRIREIPRAQRFHYTGAMEDGFVVKQVEPCTCRLHGRRVTGVVGFLESELHYTCCGREYRK